jgi:hypothetical protein
MKTVTMICYINSAFTVEECVEDAKREWPNLISVTPLENLHAIEVVYQETEEEFVRRNALGQRVKGLN